MTYQITKDIPPPAREDSRTRLRYPWPRMESGDSILIEHPLTEADSKKCPAQISAAMSAKRWLKLYRPGWHILCAREDSGIRIWIQDPTTEEAI